METPRDLEAERQVLGALLIRIDLFLRINSIVGVKDFYLKAHRILFEVLQDFYNSSSSAENIDPIQIIQLLKDKNLLDAAGGDTYILKITENVLAPGGSIAHAQRLRNMSTRRSLIDAATAIQEDANRPFENEQEFLKQAEDRILNITNRSFSNAIHPIGELKTDFSEYVQTLIESQGAHTGLISHFHEFDDLTAGLKGGELVILASRPGMGKSTFALNMAANVAMINPRNVLIFSLEMSKMELLLRLVCSTAQFNHGDLKRGNIPENRASDIMSAIQTIFAAPLYIDDTGTLDIYELVIRSRKLAIELEQKGESLGLIIVDYLQLLSDPDSRRLGRQHEVATISRNLKQLAKTINVPVLALSQMNRSVEQRRGDARPQLSDLRESGAIEQDADIVMFIHRELLKDEDSAEALENRGTAEMIIAKHRNGPVGSFRLAFRPEINRFDNLAVYEPSLR